MFAAFVHCLRATMWASHSICPAILADSFVAFSIIKQTCKGDHWDEGILHATFDDELPLQLVRLDLLVSHIEP